MAELTKLINCPALFRAAPLTGRRVQRNEITSGLFGALVTLLAGVGTHAFGQKSVSDIGLRSDCNGIWLSEAFKIARRNAKFVVAAWRAMQFGPLRASAPRKRRISEMLLVKPTAFSVLLPNAGSFIPLLEGSGAHATT